MKNLALHAGTVEGEKEKCFVAREIMVIGSVLATMIDEFHPESVMFSETVERIVRRLLLLEE